jgi:hypothetical protein
MSDHAVTNFQSVPNLPKIDPATIDTNKWPLREADEASNDEWWRGLGEDGRAEYAAAMDDIQLAEIGADGSLVTATRTFRFWSRQKNYRPYLTRLDWTSPDGQTYAFTYEPDMKLRDLADTDPFAAAKELSRRFVICATDPAGDYSDVEDLLHAAAVRAHFISNKQAGFMNRATVEVDPWTDTFVIEGEDHDPIDTGIRANARFIMEQMWLEGPRTDKQLLMSPAGTEGTLGYGSPFECMTNDQFLQMAAEANVILGAAGVPEIDPQCVVEKISKLRPYVTAYEQLTSHLAGTLGKFCEPYGMDVYAENDEGEFAIAMLRDLETATKFEKGFITTAGADYIMKPHPKYAGLIVLSKIDPTDDDLDMYFRKFEISEIEADETAMLAFVKNLNARSIRNLPDPCLQETLTVFKILTLATNELVMARHSETQHDEQIEFAAYVCATLNGEVQLRIQSYDFRTNLDSFTYTAPIQIEDDGETSGISTSYRELYHDEHICGMAAENLRASASSVFEHFKLDIGKIEAGINAFYRFGRL